jgi:cytoskeleton protein RodZ
VNRKTELQFPVPVPERGVPAGAVILVGVVIAIGAYIGWYRFSGDDRATTEVVQPVPERLAPLAAAPVPQTAPSDTGVAPAAPTTPSGTGASSLAAGPAASTASGPIPVPVPVPVTVPMSPAMYGPPAPPVYGPPAPGTSLANNGVLGAPADGVPMPPGAPGSDGSRIVLRAKADAWMQVRDKQGQVLLNRVLRGGETWPVPAKANLLLTTGNASGTEMLIDGVAAPPFVTDKSVLRDLPLDADLIKEGKLTGQANAQGPATQTAARPGTNRPY